MVEAAHILCSFTNRTAVPSSPPKPMSLPSAARRKKRSRDESRSPTGWIAAAEAAKIVPQKTAEVSAENGCGRTSSPDSPLDFWRVCEQTPPTTNAAATAAAAVGIIVTSIFFIFIFIQLFLLVVDTLFWCRRTKHNWRRPEGARRKRKKSRSFRRCDLYLRLSVSFPFVKSLIFCTFF